MNSLKETQILLNKHREGDLESLDHLYSKYYTRLGAIVRARIGTSLKSNTSEEDILQSAIMESLKSIDKFEYRTEGAFMHWMGKIITNKINDKASFFKAKKRDASKTVGEVDVINEPIAQTLTPSAVMSKNEDIENLYQLLDSLPEDQKELIIMNKIEEMSYSEIALEIDSTPEAVRKKISRIMIKLSE